MIFMIFMMMEIRGSGGVLNPPVMQMVFFAGMYFALRRIHLRSVSG